MTRRDEIPCERLISVRASKARRNRIEVGLERVADLKAYDAVELHVVFYPYSENVHADDYTVFPFEEYAKDIAKHWRSAYEPIRAKGKEIFGLLLGLFTFLLVLKYTHTDVITMESLIGIFAAYFIGKDLWDDIVSALEALTRRWRLRYRECDYRYKADKNSTLLTFNSFARRKQLQGGVIYPESMDFVARSRSSTVRMRFNRGDLKTTESSARLFTIEIDERKMAVLRRDGYLIGVKATFGKRFFGVWHNIDAYQSIDGGNIGCLGGKGEWRPDTVFRRKHLTLGRLRWTASTGYIEKTRVFG